MKKIIDGVSYDTDTATRIATGSHDHELSDAWWSLYRTEHGAFFEVVADHDGRVTEFNPLTHQEARRFLEVNANDQVEKYFGPMPAARPLPFSRKTILAASKVMARMFHGDLSEFLLELGPEYQRAIPDQPVSMQKRLVAFVTLLDAEPHKKLDDGEFLQNAFVRKAVSMIRRSPWGMPAEHSAQEEALIQSLAVDGYTYADGDIRRTLPVEVGAEEAESEIDRLLGKHGFAVPKEHLRQATDAHARGDWAAANSQLRTFMESLLDEIAVALGAGDLPSGHQRRQRLGKLGFFIAGLNEWEDNGQGFVNGLMRRLHPAGSHPGLSDAEDCTFRLSIVMLTARLFLARLDAQGP